MRYGSLCERFEAKVSKTDSCWIWTGARLHAGYGVLWSQGKNKSAHRVSWELANGAIQGGLCVLHRCDNPPCVNPGHLFLGTKGENNSDRSAKGRDQRGENHYLAKLDCAKAKEIMRDSRSNAEIARDYGVSRYAIWSVKTGKTWGHAT